MSAANRNPGPAAYLNLCFVLNLFDKVMADWYNFHKSMQREGAFRYLFADEGRVRRMKGHGMNGTNVMPSSVPNAVEIPQDLQHNVFITTLDKLYNWSRSSSMWPMMFGLACCAIEMICTAASRYDLARFGMEVMRPSPRQSDLMIVSGTVTKKMVPQIVRIYNQMSEPRYVISMGACATGGGPFKEGYNVVSGIDKYLPVDVYVPGCPPTPEALLHGFMKLFDKIQHQSITQVSWYRKTEPFMPQVPVLGPDIFRPEDAEMIAATLHARQTPAPAAAMTSVPLAAPKAAAPKPAAPAVKGPAPVRTISPEEIAARQAKLAERKAAWAAAGKNVLSDEQLSASMEKARRDAAERKAREAQEGAHA